MEHSEKTVRKRMINMFSDVFPLRLRIEGMFERVE